ncbi:MAG: formylglycine-generating enzyme family protein [Planctomycetes bacterium]|nr:formylglycine-generating enzyme family protein [Planctomycetota bacterium]
MNLTAMAMGIVTSAISISVGCDGPVGDGKAGEKVTNSLGMEFVYVPPGEFLMGSALTATGTERDEMPQHPVRIDNGFLMGRTEVTKGQFNAFVEDALWETQAEREGWAYGWRDGSFQILYGASFRDPGFDQMEDHPAVCVSWNDAVEFCRWLSHREGKRYRLPTEAEWEYGCRAGSQAAFQWSDRPEEGAGWCNVADLTARENLQGMKSTYLFFPWRDGYTFTAPVGRFRANAFGLHDMHGNVLEFCSDWYANDYYATGRLVDPQGPETGQFRILRGGDWSSGHTACRSAKRYRDRPGIRCSNLGFRIVMDPNQSP